MATKKHDEMAERINNITREQKGLEAGPKSETHVDFLKSTLKRIPNWKIPGHNRMYGFWFKKLTSILDRQALERNKCLKGAQIPDWMTKEKDHTDLKWTNQRNSSKQLQTDNLPTNDEENTYSTNKRKYLLLPNKLQIVPWRRERMPERIQRHSRVSLHRSTHPQWEQDQTEKSSYGLDRLQNGIRYGASKCTKYHMKSKTLSK